MSDNSVGVVHEEEVKGFVRQLADQWLAENPKPKWWQLWKNQELKHKAAKFLLDCVDLLVNFVEGKIPSGPDKKATVLAAVAALYDLIVTDLLPLWFKPFATGIKQFFVYVLISLMIDFIVNKYNGGAWKPEEQNGSPTEQKTM